MPFVSVVIPTLNREEPLRNVLDYFLNSDKYPKYEIIVIDQSDRHEPQTIDFLSKAAHIIHYVRVSYKNLSKARNDGSRMAKGEIVLYVDDDIEPGINFISSHVFPYVDPQVMGVAGFTLCVEQDFKILSELDEQARLSLLTKKQTYFQKDSGFQAFWAPGCNCSYRKDLIERLGGFDENFMGLESMEDAEFSHRCSKNQAKICYNPSAYALHRYISSGGCRDQIWSNSYIRAIAYNTNYFFLKVDASNMDRYKSLYRSFKGSISRYLTSGNGNFLSFFFIFIKGLWSSQKAYSLFLKRSK